MISDNSQKGGTGGLGGGGIQISNSSTTMVLSNTITGNSWGSGNGGGIALDNGGQSVIMDNLISGNTASGVFNEEGQPAAAGGAIATENESEPLIIQNLIFSNTADLGGGVYISPPSEEGGTLLVNNTIANNTSTQNQGSAFYAEGYAGPSELFNNLLIGSGTQNAVYCDGSFSTVPPVSRTTTPTTPAPRRLPDLRRIEWELRQHFRQSAFHECSLGRLSSDQRLSAIDAGQNDAPSIPATDYYGNPRVVAGKAGDEAIIDIGAANSASFADPAGADRIAHADSKCDSGSDRSVDHPGRDRCGVRR